MKKILFLVTSFFILVSCDGNKDEYMLTFYTNPPPSITDEIVVTGLASLEECRSEARTLLNEYPNGYYACATKCEKKVDVDGEVFYICEEESK